MHMFSFRPGGCNACEIRTIRYSTCAEPHAHWVASISGPSRTDPRLWFLLCGPLESREARCKSGDKVFHPTTSRSTYYVNVDDRSPSNTAPSLKPDRMTEVRHELDRSDGQEDTFPFTVRIVKSSTVCGHERFKPFSKGNRPMGTHRCSCARLS